MSITFSWSSSFRKKIYSFLFCIVYDPLDEAGKSHFSPTRVCPLKLGKDQGIFFSLLLLMLPNWSLKLIMWLLNLHSSICFLANLKIVTTVEETERGMEAEGSKACREIKTRDL